MAEAPSATAIDQPPDYCRYAGGRCDQDFSATPEPEIFFLYPSRPEAVASTIGNAVEAHNRGGTTWRTWRDLEIAGQMVFCEICKAMRFASTIVVDVSTLNFNVLFEIGFGIGLGQPVIPIRDRSWASDVKVFEELGLLDTLGYIDFVNGEELTTALETAAPKPLTPLLTEPNRDQPLYVMKSPHDTDGQLELMATIKKSALRFRTYDPKEIPRLSLHDARTEVAQSFGVVAHLLDPARDGALVHNARCAFVSGLAMAQQKVVVMFQESRVRQPIDYRDVVHSYSAPVEIKRLFDRPARTVVDHLQSSRSIAPPRGPASALEAMNLGDVAAENEITALESYFVQTGQAHTARQGNARLVVGRKGTGKTAIFYHVREEYFHRRSHMVLDMKPEGHYFGELRDTVLARMGPGLQEHTMVAYWNYILLAEISRQIIDDWPHVRHNQELLEAYTRVESVYQRHNPGFEADFSQRLLLEANRIAAELGAKDLESIGPQLTELIYSGDIRELNEAVAEYLSEKAAVWLLLDNLDKSWPIRGSTDTDILIVRALLEATRKLQRELESRDVEFHCLVFLRTDIYEHLVALTPDKGKDTAIRLDWEDPALLEEVVRKRITASTELDGTIREVWSEVCVSHVDAEDTFNYMIDRTLMRPRDLLLFVRKLVEVAINRGHHKIAADDFPTAERAYSEDMLLITAYEIGDTHPEVADALYGFQGSDHQLAYADLVGRLLGSGLEDDDLDSAIDLLLWFGFLGVQTEREDLYSHLVQFNIARLRALVGPGGSPFVIHPAFRLALDIT
jgi:hypothetical protein